MATMEMRRLRKIPTISTISDENMVVTKTKLNQTKAPTEMKRAALGDLTSNRIHAGTVGLSNSSVTLKSKLPVLKTSGPVKTKSKIAPSKENQVPSLAVTIPKLPVNTLIDKTKSLKLEALKRNAKQIEAEVDINRKDELVKTDRPFGVEDIDKKDHHNPFLVAAYAKDIYSYLRNLEKTHVIQEDYLKDRNITPKMRSILIDWLVEVQQEYKLLQETLHIAVGILDTYLQNKPEVSRHHMQLIGVTSLFLASKYEEIYVPSAEELVYISASAFKDCELYEMERQMFKTINFDLSRPISLSFLRRYSKAGYVQTQQHNFAKYFLELSLLEYSLCHVHPSLVAAAALYLALFVTGDKEAADKSLWTPTLEYYSEYKFSEVKPIVKILAKLAYNAKTSQYTAVYQKYAKTKFLKVSENSLLYATRVRVLASIK